MKRTRWCMVLLTAGGLLLAGTGCENDGDDPSDLAELVGEQNGSNSAVPDTETGPALAAGNWTGTRSSGDGSSDIALTLAQAGDAVTGTYSDSSGFKGNVTGSAAGQALDLSIAITEAPAPWATGVAWDLDAGINAAGNRLDGSMSMVNPFNEPLTFAVTASK